MQIPALIIYIEALIFGLMVGSFLNVCIYRIPKNMSIMGRSMCPKCQKNIPLFRNIPIISYVLQGGKSSCCKQPISAQYPLVEALTGFISVITMMHINPNQEMALLHYFLWFCLFMCPLIIVSIIDLQLKIIPDIISLPFILVGIGVIQFERFPDWLGALKHSGLGILIGGGSLWLIAEVVSRLKKTDAMGGGDIKLAAMLGAFLGWKALIFVFFSSSILALVFAIAKRIFAKPDDDPTIPFGPFLSMGGMIFWLYGKPITDAYFLGMGFSGNPFFP